MMTPDITFAIDSLNL